MTDLVMIAITYEVIAVLTLYGHDYRDANA